MSDWRTLTLDDVIELQRGHDLPATTRGDGAVPVIGSFGVTGYHDVARYQGPGVAIGRSGASIGVATYCPSPFWPLNTCLFVKDFRGNDPRWVYYLLDGIDFSGFNSGSAQPSLNRNYLKGIPVRTPPLVEQRAIAGVLGALDDKIESNRRVWLLRQEIARTFFDGLVFESSNSAALGDFYSVGISGVWGYDRPEESATVATTCLRGRDIEDFVNGSRTEAPIRFISTKQHTSRAVAPGEIWTAGSGSLGPSMYFTEATESRWNHPVTYSNFVKRLLPTTRGRGAVCFHAIWQAWLEGRFSNFRTGTAMPNPDAEALLRGVQVPEVDDTQAHRLEELTELAFDPQVLRQNESLIQLRDALLPELLSGRLRVRDAEKAVEEVV